MDLLPHAFLFRYALPVPRVAELPLKGKWPVGTKPAALPLPSELDSPKLPLDLRVAWNTEGLGLAVEVTGKSEPPYSPRDEPQIGDGLHVWIDTRNTQGAHRAGRFCHRFALLPALGRGKSAEPAVRAIEIPRARDTPPEADLSQVRLAVEVTKTGYRLEAWLPATVLHGYDPAASPRLGFYAILRDSELGDRPLGVGDEFPVDHDPSLWATLELADAGLKK